MQKFILIFFFGIFGIFGIGLSVYFMSDFQKAKALLFFTGVENEVDSNYVEFQKIIKTKNLKQVSNFQELPEKYLNLIEKFNQNERSYNSFPLKEKDFAYINNNWNNEHASKSIFYNDLKYFLYSNKYLIVHYYGHGGFAALTNYDIYKINQDSIIPIEKVYGFNDNIFDLILRIHLKPEEYRTLEIDLPTLETENQ